jgi:hypothetical protein
MGNIEHLPERLAVLSWDRHANPEVVRSTRNMAVRDGEVEYVRADLYGEAVAIRDAADEVIAAWDAMDGTEPSRGALMGAFGSLRLALRAQ